MIETREKGNIPMSCKLSHSFRIRCRNTRMKKCARYLSLASSNQFSAWGAWLPTPAEQVAQAEVERQEAEASRLRIEVAKERSDAALRIAEAARQLAETALEQANRENERLRREMEAVRRGPRGRS